MTPVNYFLDGRQVHGKLMGTQTNGGDVMRLNLLGVVLRALLLSVVACWFIWFLAQAVLFHFRVVAERAAWGIGG